MITHLSQLNPNGIYSYADYLSWKFDEMVELIKGKLVLNRSVPAETHQECSMNLSYLIKGYLWKEPCRVYAAPFDVRLPKAKNNTTDEQVYTVVQPDICVVCDLSKIDKRGCLGSPDWIIEIVSPGSVKHDTITKKQLYESVGVQEYWVAMPGARAIWVHILQDDGTYNTNIYEDTGLVPVSIFEGFSIDLNDVFGKD